MAGGRFSLFPSTGAWGGCKASALFTLSLFFLLSLFSSCGVRKGGGTPSGAGRLPVRHASLLVMQKADSFTYVAVKSPWRRGRLLAEYVLVPQGKPVPRERPAGVLLRTPLRRAVVTTAVHAALLEELGALPRVAGVTDAEYVVSPSLRGKIRSGAPPALGSAFRPDVERLRLARPDALFVSPMENAGNGVLETLGVPLVQCADYLETSPLGRAEWMRFYGRLFGCGEKADSLFAAVERDYLALKKADGAKGARTPPPVVLFDLKTAAVWYQPGGRSTMGQLAADAGAASPWGATAESGSLPLDFEAVYARAARADIWLVKYGSPVPLTYARMAGDFPQCRLFRPWQTRRVWACNTLRVPFYEEVPFHPERLLREWAAIVRGSPFTPRYYFPLPE